jgi:hypothetical protein
MVRQNTKQRAILSFDNKHNGFFLSMNSENDFLKRNTINKLFQLDVFI